MLKRRFVWRAQGILHPDKSEKNVMVLCKFQKRWQAWDIVGHLKRIWKDEFRVAGAVQETWSAEMLGDQRADFLREVAFWSIRSSGLLRCFCVTGATLRMAWPHFFMASAILYTHELEKSQNALVHGRQLCTQLSMFEGNLAELLCF